QALSLVPAFWRRVRGRDLRAILRRIGDSVRKAAGQLPAAEPSETWESPVFRSAAQRANLALFADHVNAENNPVTFYRRLPLLKPEPYQWDGRQLKLAGN